MLYGQMPTSPYGQQSAWQTAGAAGVPWTGAQQLTGDQGDWEWYDDWEGGNPHRRRRRIRRRRFAAPFRKAPFAKLPFGKVPFGKVPFGKGQFGKVPFSKSPYGKSPFGKYYGQ